MPMDFIAGIAVGASVATAVAVLAACRPWADPWECDHEWTVPVRRGNKYTQINEIKIYKEDEHDER